ncbi:MAG: hypothetical protein ACJ8FS_03960 [Sphingomicrobium sp.]
MRSTFGVFVLAMVASPLLAQQPPVMQKLTELNAAAPQASMSDLQAAAAINAKAYSAAKKTCAPASLTVSEVTPVTGAGVILQAVLSGKIRNAWTLYANHVGCPGDDTIRYLVLQLADGSLKAARVNQGRTLANPTIMRDTSSMAALAALRQAKLLDSNCKGDDMAMGPTRVVGKSKDLGPEQFGVRYVGGWSEVWQFRTCGKKFDVPIDFNADGDGGAYTNVKASAVTLAP